jgi:large subunit ribosomal protein L29
MDSAEMERQSKDILEQAFRLRFQLTMGQSDGLKKLRAIKKDRARMLTILRERELHPETAPEPVAKKKKKGK